MAESSEVSFPTPHTLHPTPHTPHPTPHTPHPTPHTLHPTTSFKSGSHLFTPLARAFLIGTFGSVAMM
ncbi:MAG: hypothetical protein PX481_06075 [Microcystis sp. M53603_WE2]|uniref:hypothetical protein n=1 Tax=unclassified Microcystis TaxID=2643300 RepID=UPI0008FF99BE|nr:MULTISPECIES: hypothetical protein [unclassified Microcystis]MCE2664329.1 hypothetical protein [Microcystis sp. 53602_E8]MCZ8364685.1 hypothetical protein [Microcystis sp. LE19-251.1A]MDJ0528866.1 hypothetical protein [Microcystis sp. M53600_WE12]MDJ0538262.1 hypothetical protein [Microcystis sp. M53603_WE2]MDJ0604125.1 hypothetical protein [Microcystis sp. M53602_WE12]